MLSNIFREIELQFKTRYKGWDGAEQFEGSGERLRRLVDEMCWTPDKIKIEEEKLFKAVYKEDFDEMLVSGPTSVWTFCPHHILPCNFKTWIGYIPNGYVLGLSKFSRVSVTLGRRPIMQETFSRELADSIMANLKPRGVGVFVVGTHGCIGCRGVNQSLEVSTTTLKGIFKTEKGVKEEFYNMIDKGRSR